MLFWQFSSIIINVKNAGKIPHQHLSVWLFSNPEDKVQILVESMGQICPVVLNFFTLSSGFENNHTFKCWSCIFPTIFTSMIMLENCQKRKRKKREKKSFQCINVGEHRLTHKQTYIIITHSDWHTDQEEKFASLPQVGWGDCPLPHCPLTVGRNLKEHL